MIQFLEEYGEIQAQSIEPIRYAAPFQRVKTGSFKAIMCTINSQAGIPRKKYIKNNLVTFYHKGQITNREEREEILERERKEKENLGRRMQVERLRNPEQEATEMEDLESGNNKEASENRQELMTNDRGQQDHFGVTQNHEAREPIGDQQMETEREDQPYTEVLGKDRAKRKASGSPEMEAHRDKAGRSVEDIASNFCPEAMRLLEEEREKRERLERERKEKEEIEKRQQEQQEEEERKERRRREEQSRKDKEKTKGQEQRMREENETDLYNEENERAAMEQKKNEEAINRKEQEVKQKHNSLEDKKDTEIR